MTFDDWWQKEGGYAFGDRAKASARVVWDTAVKEEREACADMLYPTNPKDDWTEYAEIVAGCAERIRNRGK